MNNNIIFFSLLLMLLSVSAVSAADLNVTDSSINIDDSQVYSNAENLTPIMNDAPGNFNDLQKEINNAPSGSVLNLTRDYNGAENLKIQINKNLTIDGQGHTINCLEKEDCIFMEMECEGCIGSGALGRCFEMIVISAEDGRLRW